VAELFPAARRVLELFSAQNEVRVIIFSNYGSFDRRHADDGKLHRIFNEPFRHMVRSLPCVKNPDLSGTESERRVCNGVNMARAAPDALTFPAVSPGAALHVCRT
jgi:hypothetical protein